MNLGKCKSCNTSVYQMEGVTVGPPGQELIFHDKCFKCSEPGCTWKLNYSNYCFSDGHPWCRNHNPMTGTSNTLARTISQGGARAPSNPRINTPPAQTAAAPASGVTFCSQCGSKRENDAAFCGQCGAKY